MNNKQKLMYGIALGAFTSKIVLQLYVGEDFLWPAIGMLWCLSSLFNDIRLNQLKNN